MTIQEFLEIFPEFNCISEARVNMVLNESICGLNKESFGTSYSSAIAYRTAHELSLIGVKNGQVTQEKVGDLSRSYHVSDDSDSYYKQTQFGLKYLTLRASASVTPLVLTGTFNGCC